MTGPMRNKFAGVCTRCAAAVAAGDGLAEKVGGRWQVAHVACPPPEERPGLPAREALRRAGFGPGAYEFGGRDHDEGDR